MAGTGRLIFNDNEKMCLQELIIKYRLNSIATTMGNPAAKKAAWTRLTEEYNAIETNTKRTEAQLKKCWDNLKTRRKTMLAQEKRERMRTGGGSFNPSLPSTSSQVLVLEDALTEQTDVELLDVIDSDTIPSHADAHIEYAILPDTPLFPESETERGQNTEMSPPRVTESRLTDFEVTPSQGSRNIRTRVIQQEFSIRQKNYNRSMKREEELHKLQISEREWMVKAAEENYYRACAERKAAEELACCNQAKKEEAELRLSMFKNKK